MDTIDGYRHLIEQRVIFRDIDYFHHANNAAYSTWTETARMSYMRDVLGIDGLEDMNIVLGSLSIRFESPALYGETLVVGTRVSWLGRKSFGMDHQIRGPDRRLVASVETTQVAFEHRQGRSIEIPSEWRQKLEEYEGRSLAKTS